MIEDFFEKVRSEGVRRGYTETQWGRRRYYHKGVFSTAEIRRQAGNHVIQGCSLGTTRIQTKELGIVQLQDVSGFNLSVWNGTKWTRGDILPAGKKQKCIVTFRGGQQFICSPEHLFQVVSHKGNKRWVACKDLLAKENVKHAHSPAYHRS